MCNKATCHSFDYQLVDKDKLKQSGASGIVQKGDGVQVIYGPKVTVIKSNLEDYLESPESDNPIIDEDSNNIGINVDDTNTNISDVNRDNTNVRDMDSKIYQKNNLSAEVYLPINGKVIPLEEIEDGVFSEKCLVKVLLLNHQRVRFMHQEVKSMNKKTNEELQALVDKATAGDKKALETLVMGVQDIVFNLSLRMLGTFADAEDATQDILLKMITHLSSFQR